MLTNLRFSLELLNQRDGFELFDSLGRTKLIRVITAPIRPGRIEVNEQTRLDILKIYADPVNKGGDIDYEDIVEVGILFQFLLVKNRLTCDVFFKGFRWV